MADAGFVRRVKSAVVAGVRRSGYEVRAIGGSTDAISAFAYLARVAGCRLVLDVGANAGEFVTATRARGYAGDVISFEPRSAAFAALRQASARDPRWRVRQLALGAAAGSITMNVSANGVSSSMLALESESLAAEASTAYVAAEEVQVDTLDAAVAEAAARCAPLAIKLDVQGYEAAVLDGAVATLEAAAVISLELSLAPVYEGQAGWRELLERLEAAGFELFAVEQAFCDPATARTLQIDAVLRRAVH